MIIFSYIFFVCIFFWIILKIVNFHEKEIEWIKLKGVELKSWFPDENHFHLIFFP